MGELQAVPCRPGSRGRRVLSAFIAPAAPQLVFFVNKFVVWFIGESGL